MDDRDKKFGESLRNLRKEKRLTLRQVEKIAKISNSYLSQIEQGKRSIPSIETLERLAGAYGVSLFDLIDIYVLAAQKVDTVKGTKKNSSTAKSDSDFINKLYTRLTEANRELLKSVITTLIDQQNKQLD